MKIFPIAACALALMAMPAIGSAETIKLTEFLKTGRTVNAVINGAPGTFLFDTGGGISLITPEFAAKIGCQPWGQITGHQMSGKRLDSQRCNDVAVRFGDFEVNLDGIGVFDFQKLLPPNTAKIDGSLALDLFDNKVVRFSQSQSLLTVLDNVPDDLKQRTALPVHIVREAGGFALTVSLPVHTSAGTAWFEMDSGNTSPYTLVNRTLAASLGMRPVLNEEQQLAMNLGDGTQVALKAIVLDLIIDGNLGTNFLAKYDVTVDFKARRAWIVPISNDIHH